MLRMVILVSSSLVLILAQASQASSEKCFAGEGGTCVQGHSLLQAKARLQKVAEASAEAKDGAEDGAEDEEDEDDQVNEEERIQEDEDGMIEYDEATDEAGDEEDEDDEEGNDDEEDDKGDDKEDEADEKDKPAPFPDGEAGGKNPAGASRRRCPKSFVNCATHEKNKETRRCKYLVGKFSMKHKKNKKESLLQTQEDPESKPKTDKNNKKEQQYKTAVNRFKPPETPAKPKCINFKAKCGSVDFCGLAAHKVIEFGFKNGFHPIALCFKTVWTALGFEIKGGYRGAVPAWYMYRDYRNIHKCIDGEMKQEKEYCEAQVEKTKKAKRTEFIDRMEKCAQKNGASKFEELIKKCDDGDVLKKMQACKEEVLTEMTKGTQKLTEEDKAAMRAEAKATREKQWAEERGSVAGIKTKIARTEKKLATGMSANGKRKLSANDLARMKKKLAGLKKKLEDMER